MKRQLLFSISLCVIALLLLIYPSVISAGNYATLAFVADNFGNVNTNSWSKGTGGDWSCTPNCPHLSLQVGDVVTITAVASDPNNLPLEYQFTAMRGGRMLQSWGSANTYVWNVIVDDVGPNSGVMVGVRNNDGLDWQGASGDDYTYMVYNVTNPGTAPAVLTQVSDNFGNVNTNSWGKGTGGDWSCAPNCPHLSLQVGDAVTFVVIASDPRGLPLQFQFTAMRGGRMLQPWSSSNTYIWNVIVDDVGPNSGVMIAVRNNDGVDWLGAGADDYTYAVYTVTNPGALPAVLTNVRDSFGNVNTNSWGKGTGGDWPVPPTSVVAVGGVVTFTATATDPKGLPLEYKFDSMNGRGLLQNWSANNIYVWNVTLADYGPHSGVMVSVRNNDGVDWMGAGADDYTYATYPVMTVKETVPQSGGSLIAPNASGTFTLTVPGGAVGQTTVFTYTEVTTTSVPGYSIVGNMFTLQATQVDGTSVVTFTTPVTVELKCNTPLVSFVPGLFYLNPASGTWIPVESGTLQLGYCRFAAQTSHFTRFAFLKKNDYNNWIYLPFINRR
jgi:hypothetical protein